MIELKEWRESEVGQTHIQVQKNERTKNRGNKDKGKRDGGGGGDNMSNTSNKKQKRLIKRKAKELIAAPVTQVQENEDTKATKTPEIDVKSMIPNALSEFTEKSSAGIFSTTIPAKEHDNKVTFGQKQLLAKLSSIVGRAKSSEKGADSV